MLRSSLRHSVKKPSPSTSFALTRGRKLTPTPGRAARTEAERLENRYLLSAIAFVQPLGVAGQFNKSGSTSLDLPTTGATTAGDAILLEFAVQAASGPVTAFAHQPGNPTHLVDFHADADVTNTSGGSGGAVRTVILSALGAPALPAGSIITLTFPSTSAQTATAAEFSGIASSGALDRVATATGTAPAVSSGLTAPTSQADELLIGAVGVRGQADNGALNDPTHNLGFAAGAGYTVFPGTGTPSGNKGNKNVSLHPEYQVVSATGAFQATGQLDAAAVGPWATAIATYHAPTPADHFAVSAPSNVIAGQPYTFTVVALGPGGTTDPDFTGTAHFTTSDPGTGVVLPMDYTFTPGDAGQHTFTNGSTLVTAGIRSLTATDTAHPTLTGAASISVLPAAATHFAVSAPSTSTAGNAFNLTVAALDPFNNVATNYSGSVHFTATDGQAVLPANSVLANGVGSFSATLKTAGTQTVTATDTANASVTGASNTILVSSAAATHFAVSAPSTSTAGTAFTFAVTALDQFNNASTGYSGTVHFTATDGQAVLPANSTLTNGTGAFSATLKTAGNQTLTATDTTNSSVTGTSNSILVTPAAVSHFGLSAPATVPAGSAFSTTLSALDPFNNVATAYRGTVHFTSSDPTSGVVLPADYTFTAADSGVHTFSNGATLITAGPHTLTATDTATPTLTGSTTVTVQAAAATHFAVSTPSTTTAGNAFTFTTIALDAFNNVATGYSGTTHFTSTDGQAVLPANPTLTNGVGFFSATLKTAGTQTITATDTLSSSITGTSNFVFVSPAAATHFALSAPASSTAGTAFTFTVTALDQFNNTSTGFGGTVHFTATDGQATLPANSTLTNGTGAFSATLKTAGSQTLTATDTAAPSITGTSNTIQVSAAAVTHFALSAPATVTAGSPFSATLSALDPFNNVATSYRGTVHFTSSDPSVGVVLPANYTFTAGDSGVHTFSNANTLITAGPHTLTATDTSTPTITGSTSITVQAAAATHFAVSAPSTTTAGNAFTFVVIALDQFNNTSTGYGGTVHFTATDGNATLPANSTLTNGVGTFSSTFRTAGSQNLTATDTANSSLTATSNTILVSSAAATHFAVSAPSTSTAGTAFTFTVTALDPFNNASTGYSGTVHFTASDGQATLPANSTLSNGVGSFSATFRTAGTQSLTATDTANASITGSASIVVSAAAVTHFAVSAPSTTTAGNAFTFTTTALDAFNNTATGYSGTVHFTASDGQAVLPANSTLTNGVGSFSATLKTAGTQSLTATDTANSGVTGSGFVIVAAAAATHFAVSAPASSLAGAPFTFAVTALDQFNNTSTGYSGMFHFTSSDASASLPANSTLTNGTGSFSAALITPGTQSITATDTANAGVTGTASVNVVGAAGVSSAVINGVDVATLGGTDSNSLQRGISFSRRSPVKNPRRQQADDDKVRTNP